MERNTAFFRLPAALAACVLLCGCGGSDPGKAEGGTISDASPFTVLSASINEKAGGESFSFVHLTDLHIGEGEGDYGTEGFEDAPPAGDAGLPALRLREAVNWINANKDAKKISFVMVTGDITDSAERSEFIKAREILDALKVPYIPLPGNHDIWPYTLSAQAKSPKGPEYFNEAFASTFEGLKARFWGWDDGTRLTRVFDTVNKRVSYFENFSFAHKGYRFLCADLNTRTHAPDGKNGIGPEGELHDFPGGTWPWLKETLAAYGSARPGHVLVFAHHPVEKDIPRSADYPGAGIFSADKREKIAAFLKTKAPLIGAWIAGHTHKNREYEIKTDAGKPACQAIETGAGKEYYIRLITAWTASEKPSQTTN